MLRSVGLGSRERLVTVRWQGRDYLLGVTPASISLIDRQPIDLERADDHADAAASRPD